MNSQEQAGFERACARLCHDFAWAVDRQDYDAFIALFAEDGVFDRAGQSSVGHAAIRKFLDARPVDRTTRHLCTNLRFDLTGPASAKGTCSALMYQAPAAKEGQPPPPASPPWVVDYQDQYVLTSNGWKFQRREVKIIFAPA